MNKTAVFPGSFDPITKGHESVIRRALPLFDRIIVAVGKNSEKSGHFPLEKRMDWIRHTFAGEKKLEVKSYSGLTIEFCKEEGAAYLLRGLRSGADFEFEKTIAHMNRDMRSGIETIFILTLPEYAHVSSTIVREIIRNGGDASIFVPAAVALK
ncbi:MAG: pantetheine-phosphate adenylyltransferase [Bacteroidia bacterium]|nr:pantetheine-phosphate adenylyltransferase [Bacteroidia bacterium]